MLQTILASVHSGQIQLSEPIELPEGTKLLVTVLPENEGLFWLRASQAALDKVWDNAYAQLLNE